MLILGHIINDRPWALVNVLPQLCPLRLDLSGEAGLGPPHLRVPGRIPKESSKPKKRIVNLHIIIMILYVLFLCFLCFVFRSGYV